MIKKKKNVAHHTADLARSIAPLAAPQNTTSRISGWQTALRSSTATAPLRRLRLSIRGKPPRSWRPDSAAPAQSVAAVARRCGTFGDARSLKQGNRGWCLPHPGGQSPKAFGVGEL